MREVLEHLIARQDLTDLQAEQTLKASMHEKTHGGNGMVCIGHLSAPLIKIERLDSCSQSHAEMQCYILQRSLPIRFSWITL